MLDVANLFKSGENELSELKGSGGFLAGDFRVELCGQVRRLLDPHPSIWYINLDIKKRHEELDLNRKYCGNEEAYPKYDNYDAIEVDKIDDIPADYDGVMGVPISFLDKYNPDQFEILGIANSARYIGDFPCYTVINGRKAYNRILIRRRQANGN